MRIGTHVHANDEMRVEEGAERMVERHAKYVWGDDDADLRRVAA
jgi:hypothetical protein